MAVRMDPDALLAAVGPDLYRTASAHVAEGRVSGLSALDGGARATVNDPSALAGGGAGGGRAVDVWVGVIGRSLTARCDLADSLPGELCEHAVAVALAACAANITWSASAVTDGAEGGAGGPEDVDERPLAAAAESLTRDELITLVTAQAVDDPYFAAVLLARAGMLPPAGPAEITAALEVIDEAAAIPSGPHRWDLHDLVRAGRAVAGTLEVLAVRPATGELLDIVEHAARVWDELSREVYLYADLETYDTDPDDISGALADIHLRVCEELRPRPAELARRLAEVVRRAEADSCLEAPDAYTQLLGPAGLAEYEARIAAG